MSVPSTVLEVLEPLLVQRGLRLYDLEHAGGVLRVVVQPCAGRDIDLDLDGIAELSRAVSRALDERDPIPGRYTLEVTTPGLERPLRTPDHFAGAVGETVRLKAAPGVEGDRRVEGTLVAADGHGCTVRSAEGDRTIRYEDIDRARTVFEWGPAAHNQRKRTS